MAEARAWGGDCILLIMAMIDDALAAELEAAAVDWGMDVLAEVHDEAELDRALKLRTRMIGINNRNLHTFETIAGDDRAAGAAGAEDRMVVGESGLFTPDDLARLASVGVNAFLIGESLMRQADVAAATRAISDQAMSQASPISTPPATPTWWMFRTRTSPAAAPRPRHAS